MMGVIGTGLRAHGTRKSSDQIQVGLGCEALEFAKHRAPAGLDRGDDNRAGSGHLGFQALGP